MKQLRVILSFFLMFVMFTEKSRAQDISSKVVDVFPGQVAVHILPVMNNSSRVKSYSINLTSSHGWSVDGAKELKLSPNSMEYLVFTVDVPGGVSASTRHTLGISFSSLNNSEDNFTEYLSLVVKAQESISFSNLKVESKTSNRLNVAIPISNDGNTDETLAISLVPVTSNVKLYLKTAQVVLKSYEYAEVVVDVDFVGSANQVAAFQLRANSGTKEYVSQLFTVERSGNGKDGNGESEHTLSSVLLAKQVVSSDGGVKTGRFTLHGDIEGALSDYVYMTAMLNVTPSLDGGGQVNDYQLKFDGEHITVHFGKQLLADIAQRHGLVPLEGAKITYSKDSWSTGVIVGKDYNDHLQTNEYLLFDNRQEEGGTSAFIAHSYDVEDNQHSVSGGASKELSTKERTLVFYPSMIFSVNTKKEYLWQYRQMVKVAVRENLPVIMTNEVSVENGEENSSHMIQLHYSTENIAFSGNIGYSNVGDDDIFHGQVSVFVPILDNGKSTVTYSRQTTNGEPTSSIEWNADYRYNDLVFFIDHKNMIEVPLNDKGEIEAGVKKQQWNASVTYEIDGNGSISLIFNRTLYANDSSSNTLKLQLSNYYIEQIRSVLNAHVAYDLNLKEDESLAHGVSSGLSLSVDISESWEASLVGSVSYDITEELLDWSIGIEFGTKHTSSVPEKVSKVFGGKKTGRVTGVVCIDSNKNGLCEDYESRVEGVGISIGKRSIVTGNMGMFMLGGLMPDTYEVMVENSTVPSYLTAVGVAPAVTVRANEVFEVNIALQESYTVKLLSFFDANEDGQFFADVDGYAAGFTLKLFSSDGLYVTSVVSDLSGETLIDGLSSGTYYVEMTLTGDDQQFTTPSSYQITLPQDRNKLFAFGWNYQLHIPASVELVEIIEDSSFIYSSEKESFFTIEAYDFEHEIESIEVKVGDVVHIVEEYFGYVDEVIEFLIEYTDEEFEALSDSFDVSFQVKIKGVEQLHVENVTFYKM